MRSTGDLGRIWMTRRLEGRSKATIWPSNSSPRVVFAEITTPIANSSPPASIPPLGARCSMGGAVEAERRGGSCVGGFGESGEKLCGLRTTRDPPAPGPGNRGENLRPVAELVGLRPRADRHDMAQFTS